MSASICRSLRHAKFGSQDGTGSRLYPIAISFFQCTGMDKNMPALLHCTIWRVCVLAGYDDRVPNT